MSLNYWLVDRNVLKLQGRGPKCPKTIIKEVRDDLKLRSGPKMSLNYWEGDRNVLKLSLASQACLSCFCRCRFYSWSSTHTSMRLHHSASHQVKKMQFQNGGETIVLRLFCCLFSKMNILCLERLSLLPLQRGSVLNCIILHRHHMCSSTLAIF
jgi:hypothetical protein